MTAGDAADRQGRSRAAHLGPERRRPLVLDAALRVFLRRGYRGTSMQAIADEVGVTKPVVYECFRNKDTLLLSLLDREEQRLLREISAALPADPGAVELEPLLTSALDAFLRAATEAPDAWRVVFESGHGAESVVATRVQQSRDMLLGRLQELASAYMAAAGISDTARTTPVIAELLASVAESCARMIIVRDYPWTPSELARFTARVVARGLDSGTA